KLIEEENDPFIKYLYHEIFNLILDYEYENLWCELTQSLPKDYGLTPPFVPRNNIPLKIQKDIIDELRPDVIIDEKTYQITPLKTITFIVCSNKNLTTPLFSERCKYCSFQKCQEIIINIDGKKFQAFKGERLIDVFFRYQLPINSVCGG